MIDELVRDCHKPEDILGEGGLLKQLTQVVLERCLQGELTHLRAGRRAILGAETAAAMRERTIEQAANMSGTARFSARHITTYPGGSFCATSDISCRIINAEPAIDF